MLLHSRLRPSRVPVHGVGLCAAAQPARSTTAHATRNTRIAEKWFMIKTGAGQAGIAVAAGAVPVDDAALVLSGVLGRYPPVELVDQKCA